MQLGLISLQQYDPVRLATPLIGELARTLGHTVGVAVWGNRGPTIVRIEDAPSAVHVNMRHGTVMSLRGTASGLLFCAYLPRATVLPLLAAEHEGGRRVAGFDTAFQVQLARVRDSTQAVDAWCPASVRGRASVRCQRPLVRADAIGPSAIFDVRVDGAVARVRHSAGELSRQLGARRRSGRGPGGSGRYRRLGAALDQQRPRLPSRSTTSKRQPDHSTLSPVAGSRPSSSITMPASVL
jgi:DNA-binding IclR family transcriptional regulator